MSSELTAQILVQGLMIGGIYALAATGLTLIAGVMNIINIAHGELMMLAMYTTYFLYTIFGVDPLLSVFVTLPLFFVIGCFLQRFCIERLLTGPPMSVIIFAAGLLFFAQNFAAFWWTQDFKVLRGYATLTFDFMGLKFTTTRLAILFAAILVTVLLYIFLSKTRMGRAIRATSQNIESAALMGVNVKRVRVIAFGLGVALAGLAGSLLIPVYYLYPAVGTPFSVMALIVVFLGGMGSVFGALIGGLALGIIEAFTGFYLALELKDIAAFIAFIIILLVRPWGLFGRKE
ncbi:MAG: branched-chain amino acid ABC transporter permease [Nitrososphaerales archaeon]